MKPTLRRFADSATSFRANPFVSARLKLTAHYIIGMVALLAIFNLGVYGLFISDLPDKFELALSPSQRHIIDQAGERLEKTLLLVDGLMIVVVAGFGYYLAGRTLRPIEVMYGRQRKFIADAAHELRTPLTVMKTGAESVLAGPTLAEDYKKLIHESLEEVDYMSATVDDLLFLARNDQPKKPEFTKVDLQKVVQQQVELMRAYADRKDVRMEYDGEDGVYIFGNLPHLKRLLANLLQNAIDYNRPKGIVTVRLDNIKQGVRLAVEDTGIGIAGDDLVRIFDRFYKADQARKHQSGAGLGLAIVQEIVTAHGGQIEVHSQPGKGTSVAVTFPPYS
ncbi:MAG TPA: HAMP domain-containing sensor histidine kinase [Candidatus Polarisedimenticolaceae bacterium]|nr:HAMP domain-containing sensor histidine kinase [Candidatus Polarisedimenticolaceae bacterium]